MTETTPGLNNSASAASAIAPLPDSSRDYSKEPAIAKPSPDTQTQGEQDFAELGETVLHLSKGKLTLKEPSYRDIRDCRIYANRWALDNKNVTDIDPGLAELEYVVYLALACTVTWEEKSRAIQHDLNKTQFEDFSATDFRKIGQLMRSYAGNESSETGQK